MGRKESLISARTFKALSRNQSNVSVFHADSAAAPCTEMMPKLVAASTSHLSPITSHVAALVVRPPVIAG